MPNMPNANEIGKIQNLIAKNPVTFVASVFFIMFGFTYYINIKKNNDAEQYWKELYLKERAEKDLLKDELLIKAGIVSKKEEQIKQADSTVRQKTEKAVNNIINKETNEIP